MAEQSDAMRLRLILPVPEAAALVVLFFMPWLGLSCEAGQVARTLKLQETPSVESVSGLVASASARQLAEGTLTLASPTTDARELLTQERGLLKPRPWLYLGLLLPVLVAALAALAFVGVLPPGKAGKLVQLVGLAGVAIVLLASRIDYVSDAAGLYSRQTGHAEQSAPALDASALNQLEDQLKAVVSTKPTVHLWGSGGLYVMVMVAGLMTCAVPDRSHQAQKRSCMPNAALQRLRPRPAAPAASDFGPEIAPGPGWNTERANK